MTQATPSTEVDNESESAASVSAGTRKGLDSATGALSAPDMPSLT